MRDLPAITTKYLFLFLNIFSRKDQDFATINSITILEDRILIRLLGPMIDIIGLAPASASVDCTI